MVQLDTGAQLDYEALAQRLARRFSDQPPIDYLDGKTAIRDEVVVLCGCSVARAEEIVDELAARGLIVFEADPGAGAIEPGTWAFPTH